jgi:trk system potassium uptake protein TrkA
MSRQFVVIGLGRFGASVARALTQLGEEVMGIDADEEKVQALSEELLHVVVADATDPAVLESLGLRNFDVAVVSIGRRLQDSILITLALKESGIPRVIARAIDERHGRVLRKVGADRVFFPERDMGIRAAHSLVGSEIIDYIEFGSEYSIMEIEAPDKFTGSTLGELDVRAKYGITVLALKRGGEVLTAPRANDLIEEETILVVMGRNSDLRKFTA